MDRKLKNQLVKYLGRVSQKYSLEGVYLFGSQAKGTSHENSDIDLLIVSSSFEKVRHINRGIDIRLMWDVLYPMDLICVTPREFKTARNIPGTLIHEVLQHGVKLA